MEVEHVNDLLEDCINRNDFRELGKRLDDAELLDPDAFEATTWPHAMHLLAHLVAHDLVNARFMFKRIPDAIASEDEDIQKAHEILQRLWNRMYREVWDVIHSAWPSKYAMILEQLSNLTRQEIFRVLQGAYVNIDVEKLSQCLGCSIEQAVEYSTARGGCYKDTVVIMPRRPQEEGLPESEIQKLQSILVQLGQ